MAVIKTQGTSLYIINPTTDEVMDVGCITSIDGITSPVEQIDVTCFSDDSRKYVPGLRAPGTATFGIYLDTQNDTHVKLHEAYQEGTDLVFAVAFSDGEGEPTGTTLPTTRSWIEFEGYVSDFPFSFEQNSVVSAEISVQISGEIRMLPKD